MKIINASLGNIVYLDDGTDITTNSCCTKLNFQQRNEGDALHDNVVTIEYSPIKLEVKNIDDETFISLLEKASKKHSLKDYSTMELFKELTTRDGIHTTDNEIERQYIDEYPIIRRDITLTHEYNRFTDEVVE